MSLYVFSLVHFPLIKFGFIKAELEVSSKQLTSLPKLLKHKVTRVPSWLLSFIPWEGVQTELSMSAFRQHSVLIFVKVELHGPMDP